MTDPSFEKTGASGRVADKTPPRWLIPLFRQFGRPQGLLGRVALKSMAKGNRKANAWVLDVLRVGPDDRVLDIGCGPGVGVEMAAERSVSAAGVDASMDAVKAARRRNPNARIECAGADALPFADGEFTRIMTVNSMGFWPDPEAGVREAHRVLARGGRLVIALRMKVASAKATDRRAYGSTPDQIAKVENLLRHLGFSDVGSHRAEHDGETTTAIVGTRS